MAKTTEETVRGINDFSKEILAWEGRVNFLKNEAENLGRKNEQTKKEIESSLALASQDYTKKREEIRAMNEKLSQASAKLEAERVEFQGILQAFKKEKNAFEADRSMILDLKTQTDRLKDKLSNFVLMIRREAERL